ncbi:Apyrase [Aphelenchoides besseyi]|nr:Apyrase [Aphelenchoides besseyi]
MKICLFRFGCLLFTSLGFINLTIAKPLPQNLELQFPGLFVPQHNNLQRLIPRPFSIPAIEPYNYSQLYVMEAEANGWLKLPIMTIADQDKLSASPLRKGVYISPSVRGHLRYNLQTRQFKIDWSEVYNYTGFLNSKGRGMELSDLKVFNGKLYSPDDKTSIVFQLNDQIAIPWTIEPDGDGINNKTYKTEWMTIKNEELYLGGYGKEYTDEHGKFMNSNPFWIKVAARSLLLIINRFGNVRHVNWTRQFRAVRSSIGVEFPGYMIHESCQWSDLHQSWFFLPRRVSWDRYEDSQVEYKGTNYLIKTDETFTTFSVIRIGLNDHITHGFSAFQFVPEVEGQPLASYIMIFDVNGTVYLPEEKIPEIEAHCCWTLNLRDQVLGRERKSRSKNTSSQRLLGGFRNIDAAFFFPYKSEFSFLPFTMSTSQKHQNFVSEAMKQKSVTDIAGVGPTYAKKLEEHNFTKAYHLLGQFLLFDKQEDVFVDFLKDKIGMNARYAKAVFDCLNEWTEYNV